MRLDIVLRGKKTKKAALLIEVSVPSDFRLNNAEIKKMTKYQVLQNEVKRFWKLKNAKNCTSDHWSNGNDEEEPHRVIKNHPWEYYYKLQLEAVRGSVTILKRSLGTKL